MKAGNSIRSEIKRGQNNVYYLVFILLIIVVAALFILDILLGSVKVSSVEIFRALFGNSDNNTEVILFKFRLPKAITAVLVGIALSISGLQMQTLFRNPMAGPYVLGLSSGASLGVAFIILGFSSSISPEAIKGIGNWAIAAASWAGAGLVMILIMYISTRVENIMTVLILGIMLSSAISAIVSIMQYFSNETMLKAYIIWTMGSLGNLTSPQLAVLSISVITGLMLTVYSTKELNALLLGENYARTIGMNPKISRIIIIVATSLLTGTATAFCGPIGFIGIAVPHLARIIYMTSDHKIIIPGVILIGAAVMLASDIISQMPWSDNILPVNSITALIGIPVIFWIILRNRKNQDIF